MTDSIFDSAQFNQNLFFPRPDSRPASPTQEEVFIAVEEGVSVHVRKHPSPEETIFSMLYFHGNGEIVSDYDDLAPAFWNMGCDFLVCEYRGYGKSGGFPTLRSALEDSRKIYEHLQKEDHLKEKVSIMGRSLGSASAIELCSRYPEITSCVIESGYADPIPLVERRGLRIESTTPEEDALFNNSQKIKKVSCPLLIMHGEEDFLIQPHEAELNFGNAGSQNKHLEILEGVGHNDIMYAQGNLYFHTLKKFLDSVYRN